MRKPTTLAMADCVAFIARSTEPKSCRQIEDECELHNASARKYIHAMCDVGLVRPIVPTGRDPDRKRGALAIKYEWIAK